MIVDNGPAHANCETLEMVYFSHDLCKGKLVVESGATRSVAGSRVFEDYYKYYHRHLGNAESDFQPTDETPLMLTFANGQTRSSLGLVNTLCCVMQCWGLVPVHVLDAPSPLLLGVDIMRDLELSIIFLLVLLSPVV